MECKRRWRMLRVTFLRNLREKKKPSGSSGKKKKPHYLEDAMGFLIPFTKPRIQTGNVESDEERIETESYSQVHDSEVPGEVTVNETEDNIHYSDDLQSPQDRQEESASPTIQEKQSHNLATNEVETQFAPQMSTNDNTKRSFKVPQRKKLKSKQLNSENWEHAAVQCLNDLSTKYKRKMNEPPVEEDSDLLFLKSLLPDMKKLDDVQKRRYKQRILSLYDEVISNEQYVPIPLQSPATSNYSVSTASSNFNEAHYQERNIYEAASHSSYASLVSAALIDNNDE